MGVSVQVTGCLCVGGSLFRLRMCRSVWGSVSPHTGVIPSCFLSRRPCRARTRRFGQWLRMAPTGAAARPALGTRCPGTWRKPSGAGEVEVAPEEMGVSWTLPKEQSSALQVTLRNSACPVHQLSPVG